KLYLFDAADLFGRQEIKHLVDRLLGTLWQRERRLVLDADLCGFRGLLAGSLYYHNTRSIVIAGAEIVNSATGLTPRRNKRTSSPRISRIESLIKGRF